jgi:hypothetical protein
VTSLHKTTIKRVENSWLLSYYKTTIYTGEPIDILRHKETRNSYIYTNYKHHLLLGLYEINIQNLCQAANTKIRDYKQYIYFLILTQFKPLYYFISVLTSIVLYIFTQLLLYYISGNITQGFNRFLTLVYVLWDPI